MAAAEAKLSVLLFHHLSFSFFLLIVNINSCRRSYSGPAVDILLVTGMKR
jgi:hypothetical protein